MARQILIAGVDRTANILLDGFSIEQVLTQAVDSCNFRIRDVQPTEGQEVVVYDGTAKLFAGIIDQVKLVQADPPGVKIYECSCQDYTYQLDQKLVVETYSNMAADLIVKDIITKYGAGFTTNHVQSGAPVVEEIIFDYKRPSECLKELADYVGWDWYVDYDKDIWFFDPKTLNQPASMALEAGAKFRNLKHTIDQQGLRNRVYVRGGTMLSDPWTYEIKADGSARAWVLPHKPHDLILTVGGVAKTVGIENVDDEATKDFLMNYQEKYVRCSAQTATPAAGTTLAFTYKYDIDVITMVEDIASQQAIAAVQGGDGVYEHSIVDDSLTTIDAAEAAGMADLREHANPRVKGSFETEVPGWAPGQLVTINLPDRGITGTFLVQKVTIVPTTPELWTYRVEYGGRLLGIADWLQALWKAQQKKKLNETALLHKFHYGAETAKVTDEVQGTLRTPPWKVEQSYESLLDIVMPGEPSFARSSVAYKQDGAQVAANVPRFEAGKFSQAVMVEEGTTNLVPNSEAFDATSWTKESFVGSITPNAATSPWGTLTADQINITGGHVYRRMTLTAGRTYTFSCWVKSATGANISNGGLAIWCYNGAAGSKLRVRSTVTITPSWQRLSISYTAAADETDFSFIVAGASIVLPYNVYVWGAQVEEKPYATSYIPTSGATATRSPETLTIPTAGVLNFQEGTIELWFKPTTAFINGEDGWNRIIGHSTAMNTNELEIFKAGTGSSKLNFAISNNAAQWAGDTYSAVQSVTSLEADRWYYIAATWSVSQGKFALYIDGNKEDEEILAVDKVPSVVGTLAVGFHPNGTRWVNGLIDDLCISSRARTDEEIAAAYQSGRPLKVDEWTTYKMIFDGDLSRYVGFGQQYATVGGLAMVQQLDSNPWPQLQYATSADGSTWSAWLDVNNKAIDVPYPGYLKVRGAARLPVKVGVRNWKKPFDQTDVVCGFVTVDGGWFIMPGMVAGITERQVV